jgi:hypothetical protein
MARKNVIKVRLDDAEMALVDEAVKGLGIPLATWSRGALLYGVRARLSVLSKEDADRMGLEIDF